MKHSWRIRKQEDGAWAVWHTSGNCCWAGLVQLPRASRWCGRVATFQAALSRVTSWGGRA